MPFSSSPALTCLVNILLLQTDYWNIVFATVNNDPQQVLSEVSSSTVPKLIDLPWARTVLDTVLGWKKSPYICSCLSPELHRLLLKKKKDSHYLLEIILVQTLTMPYGEKKNIYIYMYIYIYTHMLSDFDTDSSSYTEVKSRTRKSNQVLNTACIKYGHLPDTSSITFSFVK